MKNGELTALDQLSPFELRNRLVALARSHADRVMLNAGRGNPNFLAAAPRHAFFQLGLFAMGEAERCAAGLPAGVAGLPEAAGIAERLAAFLGARPQAPGVELLCAALRDCRDRLGFCRDEFVHELVLAVLGGRYPEPVRLLPHCERIVRRYLQQELLPEWRDADAIDLFATEGATAGITYVFNTLRTNRLLAPGDTIAIATPIFTPYLEIPLLADYQLVELAVAADPAAGWQYPERELAKLLDPRVKAFLVVNPGNPTAVKIDADGLRRIADIIRQQRPDLIIVTDDVYATFADEFVSLFAMCPYNTILLYSFSKYFGATGWRLGVVGVWETNVLDAAIAALPEHARAQLDRRYGSLVTDPRNLKFIDRLAADSRAVALHHTAGLSTPQQVQMALFALSALIDAEGNFKTAMKRLIRDRHRVLFEALGIAAAPDATATDYYAILDFETAATALFGQGFGAWLVASKNPLEILLRLAEESGVVLLPGRGFATPHPSARISLANLSAEDYRRIGGVIRSLLAAYADEYSAAGDVQGRR